MLDITAPTHGVQVEIDRNRRVLYVHVDGITVLRICRIPGTIDVQDSVEYERGVSDGLSRANHSRPGDGDMGG